MGGQMLDFGTLREKWRGADGCEPYLAREESPH